MERIKAHGKEVILVGTAHISRQSIELVEKTIEEEKPEVVGIELCGTRLTQLRSGRRWSETNIGQIIKEGKTYLFLVNLMLSNLQKQLGKKMGVRPGAEMFAAYKIAQKQGIPIALLDRDIQVTMRRTFALVGLKEKIKLLLSIIAGFFSEKKEVTAELIEKLKTKDMMTELMEEFMRTAPTLKKVLVDERDAFIANKILSLKEKKILAVVGAGHVNGIKQLLLSGKKIDEGKLIEVPKKKSLVMPLLKWGIPAVFVILFGYAFFLRGASLTIELFAWWFLITGALSALGALLARAHPLSIATAFLAAPFTTLHPALATGWFAGAVELKVCNPKVKDFEELKELQSLGDLYKNQVTRILLVTALTNIGATIGVVIALPYIFSLLG
ncbi:MAG: TraB/GumN family protein [Candidatus Diapherotrites archaeon]